MNRQFFPSEDGFTIQELLVTLIVGSLLVDFCFSLFLFSDKLFVSWQRKSELRDRVSLTLLTMAHDVQGSKGIVMVSDTSTIVRRIEGRIVSYSFDGKCVRRNNVVLCGGSMDASMSYPEGVNSQRNKLSAQVLLLKVSSNGYDASTEVEIPYSAKEEFNLSQPGVQ